MTAILSLFSLGTLDSRFTKRTRLRSDTKELSTNPPKWKSPEFILYAFGFLIVVPMMFKAAYDVSKPTNPNFPIYEHLLSKGWIPGRLVDNSDGQYRNFRNSIPILTAVILAHQLLRQTAGKRIKRVYFDIGFATIFLSSLHGLSFIKIVVILCINYSIGKGLGQHQMQPLVTWVFNIIVLFSNEIFQGYQFGALHPSMIVLDQVSGVVPRWEVHFNFTMLRLISFNLDYFWSTKTSGDVQVCGLLSPRR